LSTPFGRRGWFYEECRGTGPWRRVQVRADQCPRISPRFLAEERAALGARWFAQEYQNSFESDVGAVFDYEVIQAALRDCGEPIFGALPAGAAAPAASGIASGAGMYQSALTDPGEPLFQ
jgi:hypothetical protein